MFPLRYNVIFSLLAILVAGVLVLSGCTGTPAAAAAALAAATEAPITAPVSASAPPAQAAGGDLSRTITVVGQGQIKAKPTIAQTNMGIEVTAATVADAMKEGRARMDAVLAALKAAGVADKDVQTSNFSINFERQSPEQPVKAAAGGQAGAIAGVYRVNNMVNVTIRDLDKVGAVVDAAVNAGANNIWGINFSIDDPSTLETQARVKAVADALARAQSLAELNHVSLGRVVAVSEVITGGPGPKAAFAAPMGLGGGGTPVEPGEVTVNLQIQVSYAIQ